MDITITLTDEMVDSLEQCLDSEVNIDRKPDNKGQLLNYRRVETVEELIQFHIVGFIQAQMVNFPPSNNPLLVQAEQRRVEAEELAKQARKDVIDRMVVKRVVK